MVFLLRIFEQVQYFVSFSLKFSNYASNIMNNICNTFFAGEGRRLRPEVEETPVEMLRVSFYQ